MFQEGRSHILCQILFKSSEMKTETWTTFGKMLVIRDNAMNSLSQVVDMAV